jgi:hypothetical protein
MSAISGAALASESLWSVKTALSARRHPRPQIISKGANSVQVFFMFVVMELDNILLI